MVTSLARLLIPPGPLNVEHIHSDRQVTQAFTSWSNSLPLNSSPRRVSLEGQSSGKDRKH